jgi:hypothetical protein
MTLPSDLPAADEVLTVTSYSGGAGVLEWAAAGGARTVSPTNVDNAVITFVDSGDTFAAEANLTFDGTDLTVGTGNVVIATAGKGIDFSAQTGTGSGTVGSELLDHYEAGTFTPSITFGNNAASMTFDSRLGSYTRVGNRVHISGEVDMSAKGTSTGTALVTGLPFTIRNNGDSKGVIGMELRQISFADYPSLVLYEGGTSLGFNETTNAGVITVLTEGNFANNSVVFFSGAYQVA